MRSMVLAAAVAPLALVASIHRPPVASCPARHVVLVSIDGLLPGDLDGSSGDGPWLSTLDHLAGTGVRATGVRGVYPTFTLPSYATIVTGARPARHGIVENTLLPLPGSAWSYEASALRAATVWELASAAGLKTASVSWPLTAGAPIDFLVPGLSLANGRGRLDRLRSRSTPNLVEEAVAAMEEAGSADDDDPARWDEFSAAAAAQILKTRKPSLLLVRFVELGLTRYLVGIEDSAVSASLTRIDRCVRRIVSAAGEAGLAHRTTFIVTGVHGFRGAHTVLQPNVLLRRAGLLKTGPEDTVTSWKAIAQKGGGIRLADPADAATAARVRTLFLGHGSGTFRFVDRAELDTLGADPAALFFMEPAVGYAVNERFDGDTFTSAAPVRGYHGFLPDSPGMESALLLSGSGVGKRPPLPVVNETDLAPTVSRLLGFEIPEAEGRALLETVAQ